MNLDTSSSYDNSYLLLFSPSESTFEVHPSSQPPPLEDNNVYEYSCLSTIDQNHNSEYNEYCTNSFNGYNEIDQEEGGDDQQENSASTNDPFSEKCKIPLPNLIELDDGCVDATVARPLNTSGKHIYIRRRNERERTRVRNVNEGFERLRRHLPVPATKQSNRDRRLSKVDTLRCAIAYIEYLQNLLESHDQGLLVNHHEFTFVEEEAI